MSDSQLPTFTNKRYENLLGQTIREERSGFQGAVLATVHTYDSFGRLVSTSADYEPTVEYTYDLFGNRVATTRMVGASVPACPPEWRKSETTSSFASIDGSIWLTQTNIVSCSDSTIATLVTSSARQLTGLTPAHTSRSRSFDVRGNVTETELLVSVPVVTSSQIVPYATNRPLTLSRYDVELQTVSVSAVTNTVVYDVLGRQTAQTDGRGNTTHTEYNAFGQRSASIDALGNRTSFAYDQFGNLASVIDPLGNATIYEYDLRGRKTYEGGATYPVRYTYDVFGNKVSMMTYRNESLGPDSGDITTWLYDEASGAMTNKVYADGKGPTYSYTPDGKLSQRTWARGIITDYTYDGWNNLTNTVYSDGTPTISLAYNRAGRLIQAIDAAGVTTFLYDDFSAVTNEMVVGVAGTNTIERFYDSFGRDTGYALNGVRQSTLAYDPATGRLATMLADGSDTPFTWNYLPGSDLKSSLTYPNGLTASWTYDPNNQLLQVRNVTPTNVISQYDYAYDAAGRRVQIARSGSAMSENRTDVYGYNSRGELTSAVKQGAVPETEYAYDYDDIGNRISSFDLGTNRTYIANNLNQYTQISNLCDSASLREEFLPQFDDDGNQTLIQTSTGIWQVQYNGENRPVHWSCVQSNNQTIILMSYDRMGRRVKYLETCGSVTNSSKTFTYDGYLQVANFEHSTSSFEHQTFLWDPTEPIATRPLVWNSSTLQPFNFSTFYYTHDGNKNVSEVVAENGDIAAHYEYAPLGAVITQRGASAEFNIWRFSSEYAEDDTKIVYYNYRHYVPMVGRWMLRDPVEESDASALYLFVCNSSVEYVDFLGLATYNQEEAPVAPPCCCKICLYSACQKGTLNNGKPVKFSWSGSELSGHSWVSLEKCDTPLDSFGEYKEIYSFGPRNVAGYKEFADGGRFASANNFSVSKYYDLKKYDVTKICWSRTSSECRRDKKAFKRPGNDGVFDNAHYCTTEALRFLKARGITPPSGVGKGCLCEWSPFKKEQHNKPNPKGLAEGIVKGLTGGDKGQKIVPREPKPKQ